ncbi:uncharacterized protein LOC111357464 isoform X5 [Spodoptera litura]|uniref:Uncharacterized protein LOC111357464 isoform X5 n=1 Tax=Spodoptera litura TaxID=69820 RepID=A0A9J7IW78_SPOLT|nr:uncharacterized protein LOC111357464 isoform X5 [Spodoptera litura]
MSQIPPMESLDCEGEPASIGLRWEKWKRGLELYLTATNVTTAEAKKATLLHMGGLSLQEIYYNLPDIHDESGDAFEVAVKKLDKYFSPKQSRVYERHLFRLIKQEVGERFDKFLVRLRHQCSKCKFTSPDDHLIDQITEKCESIELRKKILTMGDDVTLDKIISEANSLETVHRQLNNFDSIAPNKQLSINQVGSVQKKTNHPACSRCGGGHPSDSKHCSALNKKCLKCGFVGHFRNYCRTRASKRKGDQAIQSGNPTKKYKPKSKPEERVDYIFHLDGDDSIICTVGDVQIEMLIDSGSKCNIINDVTWEILKSKDVRVENQVKNPDKKFMAYGSQEPLTVLGCFDSSISADNGSTLQEETFYVVKSGTRNLLGKDTATKLGVLKVGLGVNAVDGKSPAELFYRRQFRDKLPSVIDVEFADIDLETKDRDVEMKTKGKEYADRKRHATESPIEVGEKVYLKNMSKENKLTTMFSDVPHTVVNKEGNDCELQNDNNGKRLRRNVVHLKRVEGEWKVCENAGLEDPIDRAESSEVK